MGVKQYSVHFVGDPHAFKIDREKPIFLRAAQNFANLDDASFISSGVISRIAISCLSLIAP